MKHGGKRENAGRKSIFLENLKHKSYRVTEEEDLIIKIWLKKRHRK